MSNEENELVAILLETTRDGFARAIDGSDERVRRLNAEAIARVAVTWLSFKLNNPSGELLSRCAKAMRKELRTHNDAESSAAADRRVVKAILAALWNPSEDMWNSVVLVPKQ